MPSLVMSSQLVYGMHAQRIEPLHVCSQANPAKREDNMAQVNLSLTFDKKPAAELKMSKVIRFY